MLRQHTLLRNRILFGYLLACMACGCAGITESADSGNTAVVLPEVQLPVDTEPTTEVDSARTIDSPGTGPKSAQPLGYPHWPVDEQLTEPYDDAGLQFGEDDFAGLEPSAGTGSTASGEGPYPIDSRDEVQPMPAPQISAEYQTVEVNDYEPLYSNAVTHTNNQTSTGSSGSAPGDASEASSIVYPTAHSSTATSSTPTNASSPELSPGLQVDSEPTSKPESEIDSQTAAKMAAAAASALEAEARAIEWAEFWALNEAELGKDMAAGPAAGPVPESGSEPTATSSTAAAAAVKNDRLADASIRLDYEGDYVVNQPRPVVLAVGYGLDQAELKEGVEAALLRLGIVDGNPLEDDVRLNPTAVTAELTAREEAFKITSGAVNTRALLLGKPNLWQWEVVPLLPGPQQLTLTLSWPVPGAPDGAPGVFEQGYQVSVSVDAETCWSNLVDKITEHSKKLTAMFVALLALIAAAIKLWKMVRTGKENG